MIWGNYWWMDIGRWWHFGQDASGKTARHTSQRCLKPVRLRCVLCFCFNSHDLYVAHIFDSRNVNIQIAVSQHLPTSSGLWHGEIHGDLDSFRRFLYLPSCKSFWGQMYHSTVCCLESILYTGVTATNEYTNDIQMITTVYRNMIPAIPLYISKFWPNWKTHILFQESARFGRSTTTCQDPRRTCECSKAMKLNMHNVWLSRRKDFGIQRFWQVTGAARVFGGTQSFRSKYIL